MIASHLDLLLPAHILVHWLTPFHGGHPHFRDDLRHLCNHKTTDGLRHGRIPPSVRYDNQRKTVRGDVTHRLDASVVIGDECEQFLRE